MASPDDLRSQLRIILMYRISMKMEEYILGGLAGEDGWISGQLWQYANDQLSRSPFDEENPFSQSPTDKTIFPSPSLSIPSSPIQSEEEVSNDMIQSRRGDYNKNICANMAKKALQCFLLAKYKPKIDKRCRSNGCSYQQAQTFYKEKKDEVFGLAHLFKLMIPQRSQQGGLKLVFAGYMRWFLRKKYLGYMMRFGKMSDREKYIEYKNQYLLYIEEIVRVDQN